MSLAEALKKAEDRVKKVKKTDLLAGTGDLLSNKQKIWAREKLISETVFCLALYRRLVSKNKNKKIRDGPLTYRQKALDIKLFLLFFLSTFFEHG
jgi:hypothetical protein